MNMFTFKTICEKPALLSVNVSEFRRRLKDYLRLTNEEERKIITVENHGVKDALVLSQDTLFQLQERHCTNTLLRCYYWNLNLYEYATLMNGIKTKDLPANVINGLCALFQVVHEILEYVSRPYLCDDLRDFPIRDYIRPLYDHNYPFVRGPFSSVNTVGLKLVSKAGLGGADTLSKFFTNMKEMADENNTTTCISAANEDLTQEQADMVEEITSKTCEFALALLDFQDVFTKTSPLYSVYGPFWGILNWVKDNVSGEILKLPLHSIQTRETCN